MSFKDLFRLIKMFEDAGINLQDVKLSGAMKYFKY